MNDLLELFGRLGDDEADRAVALYGRREVDPWAHERDLRHCVADMLGELLATEQIQQSDIDPAGGGEAIFQHYMKRLAARLEQRKQETMTVN